jgi:hypothetical protein
MSLCPGVALARGKRELGQDLSGAAISVVLLCEGLSRAAGKFSLQPVLFGPTVADSDVRNGVIRDSSIRKSFR